MPQCQSFIVRESMVNEALTLPCNYSGYCPAVQWSRFIPDKVVVVHSWICSKQFFQKRFTLPGDTSRGDFSLMISSVAYNDAGSYMCSCNEKSVTEVKLKVIIPTVVKAFEGKNVTLPCYGDTRQVIKDVKWKKDGHEVLLYTPANRWMTKQNRFTMSVEGFLDGDLSLHISPVHVSDTGLYQCLIHDESQDGEPRAVLLKVEVYLLMPQCQAFIVRESMVNEALTLPCNCSGNCPVVLWIHFIPDKVVVVQSWICSKQENFNKRFTLPGDTSRGDFSLMISSVAYTDAGSYMCRCNEKSVTEVKLKVIRQQQFTTTNSAPVSGGFALLGLFIPVGINIYIT
ncbi:CD226 antigen-like isoform X1 [Tachysurus fulvidraco]|uniref:CD226 antigen-like isoform X1 n=1 Tax=Tachysurus fulvidraco TaxID=1234273 RepID=UPI001FED8BE0|nr:CD226 antigen-like isoform X1 [Tachysurus fulvidraco]